MILARVEGNAISTIQHPSLKGWRQLLCQPLSAEGEAEGGMILAIDDLGAGMHQRVIITSDGKSLREKVGHSHTPLRYGVIAIVDEAPEVAS